MKSEEVESVRKTGLGREGGGQRKGAQRVEGWGVRSLLGGQGSEVLWCEARGCGTLQLSARQC